jgi:hypothetical protein
MFLFLRIAAFPLLSGHAQEFLDISVEDILIEKTAGREGFSLFIKKKPGIFSVLLAESTKDYAGLEDAYAYRTLEWNEINGDEFRLIPNPPTESPTWFLMDSTPEDHPILGKAFHIYVPPVLTYGYPGIRHDTIVIHDGLFINIRAFALPYCDYSGAFKDNPFTLSMIPKDPDALPIAQEEPEEDSSLEDEEGGSAGIGAAEGGDGEGGAGEGGSPPPEPPPKKEGLDFAPVLLVRGGMAIFFPEEAGKLIGLENTYDPIGAVVLTNKFTKNWGLHLSFDRDPILMNRVFARAIWDMDFINIELGPYFGLFNSSTGQVSPGASLALHVRIPQWRFFAFFQRDTPMGKDNLIGPGDYIQSYSEIKAGAILPFGSLALSLIDRNSTIQDDQSVDIVNQWVRYNLALEFARPTNPFGLKIDLGYQELRWTYRLPFPLNTEMKYTYKNIYAGLDLSYRIGMLTLSLGMEAPLYPWVYHQIQSLKDPQASFFGQITLGFTLAFP